MPGNNVDRVWVSIPANGDSSAIINTASQIIQILIRVRVSFVAKFIGRCSAKLVLNYLNFATKGASSLLFLSIQFVRCEI